MSEVMTQEATPATDESPAARRRRWGWGTRVVVTICVAWLLFVALHRLISGRAYWWGPFDLAPPIVFAAMPVLLLALAQLARPVRLRLSLVPVAALLLGAGLSGINAATLWHTPPPAPAGAVKLFTWNTEYWDQDVRTIDQRTTEDFYRYLRAQDADVYLLHEYAHVDFTLADVFAQAQVIDQMALLRERFPGYEIVLEGRNITLSRLPVVGHRALDSTPWLPDDLKEVPPALRPHPLFYTSQVLRTDIRVGDRVVSFYNTHLFQPPRRMMMLRGEPGQSVFEVDRFNHSMRRASYEAIRADVADNRQPIVLAGDLNTSQSMGILRMMPDRLVDHTEVLPSLYPVTWLDQGSLWRIDWVFTTPDVAVHDYDVIDPAGLSDHKAQRVLLSIDAP